MAQEELTHTFSLHTHSTDVADMVVLVLIKCTLSGTFTADLENLEVEI